MNLNLKKHFPWFRHNIDTIYMNSGSTTLKPQVVIDTVVDYMSKNGCSPHNQDFHLSYDLSQQILGSRQVVADFINADIEEIAYTSGTTESLNLICKQLEPFLKEGDEVILNKLEHTSSLLPWFDLREKKGIVIKWAEIKGLKVTPATIEKQLSAKTRVVAFAHANNTSGSLCDARRIVQKVKEFNSDIYTVIDAAQSAPHAKIDVKMFGCDFLAFSGHKLMGPTGIGLMYINKRLHNLAPAKSGGDMNVKVYEMEYISKDAPYKYEAGTVNITGILGLSSAIKFIQEIGLKEIQQHELALKTYTIKRMKEEIPNIVIYNEEVKSGVVLFNIPPYFAQDVAATLSNKGINVRPGTSCAKLAHQVYKTPAFIRASYYVYNDKEDVDKLIEALKDGGDFISIF